MLGRGPKICSWMRSAGTSAGRSENSIRTVSSGRTPTTGVTGLSNPVVAGGSGADPGPAPLFRPNLDEAVLHQGVDDLVRHDVVRADLPLHLCGAGKVGPGRSAES